MQIFAVIAPEANQFLKDSIVERFYGRYLEVAPGQFLVSDPKATTQQVAEYIGLKGNTLGKALVLLVANWNGWHDRNIWEWMTAQTTEQSTRSFLGN
jgi:hypothetical protein